MSRIHFFDRDKERERLARERDSGEEKRNRRFARLDWMTPARASAWQTALAAQDTTAANQLISLYENEGDLDHAEWLRARVIEWGGTVPRPVSEAHAGWLRRRGHYVPPPASGGYRPHAPVGEPDPVAQHAWSLFHGEFGCHVHGGSDFGMVAPPPPHGAPPSPHPGPPAPLAPPAHGGWAVGPGGQGFVQTSPPGMGVIGGMQLMSPGHPAAPILGANYPHTLAPRPPVAGSGYHPPPPGVAGYRPSPPGAFRGRPGAPGTGYRGRYPVDVGSGGYQGLYDYQHGYQGDGGSVPELAEGRAYRVKNADTNGYLGTVLADSLTEAGQKALKYWPGKRLDVKGPHAGAEDLRTAQKEDTGILSGIANFLGIGSSDDSTTTTTTDTDDGDTVSGEFGGGGMRGAMMTRGSLGPRGYGHRGYGYGGPAVVEYCDPDDDNCDPFGADSLQQTSMIVGGSAGDIAANNSALPSADASHNRPPAPVLGGHYQHGPRPAWVDMLDARHKGMHGSVRRHPAPPPPRQSQIGPSPNVAPPSPDATTAVASGVVSSLAHIAEGAISGEFGFELAELHDWSTGGRDEAGTAALLEGAVLTQNRALLAPEMEAGFAMHGEFGLGTDIPSSGPATGRKRKTDAGGNLLPSDDGSSADFGGDFLEDEYFLEDAPRFQRSNVREAPSLRRRNHGTTFGGEYPRSRRWADHTRAAYGMHL